MRADKNFRVVNFFNRVRLLIVPSVSFCRFIGWVDRKGKYFPWYIRAFKRIVQKNCLHGNLKILGLGMGVGMISHLDENWSVDYVENDTEIIKVARNHFWLPEKTNVYCVDVKKFLSEPQNLKPGYDVIFYDLFRKNKVCPQYLKYYPEIMSMLKKDGLLVINVVDYPWKLNKYTAHMRDYSVVYNETVWPFNKILSQNMLIFTKKK